MRESNRVALPGTMIVPSPLDNVVAAIARLGEREHVMVYVERWDDRYRWSIAHRGGPYPLLREVAQYLGVPHTDVGVAFLTVQGWAVVRAEGELPAADASMFIPPSSDPAVVHERIRAAQGS